MTPRDRILGKLRNALGPRDEDRARRAVEERLASRRAAVIPAMARTMGRERRAQFITKLQGTGATFERAPHLGKLGAAVRRYLQGRALWSAVPRVVVAPHPLLDEVAFDGGPELVSGAPAAYDRVALSVADLGLAESGSLLFLSSAQSPASAHFVPETEIVVLPDSAVVAGMEDAWAYLWLKTQGAMPRALHLVTGPSRTADIELTITMGAHGPRHLHVILLGGDNETGSAGSPLT